MKKNQQDGSQVETPRPATDPQHEQGEKAAESSRLHQNRHAWTCEKCDRIGHDSTVCNKKKLSEYITPLCATQSEGQAFFCIPDHPSELCVRERMNTAIITVVSGTVTAKQIEEEFTRILSGVWRWTARKIADHKFLVRFPTAQMIKYWGRFSPVGMRTVKVQIEIDPWNASIGAKGELQSAWFRVKGIPNDKRSEETLAYVGSLVGVTVEIDEKSLHKQEYVRMGIACRDITKVPKSAEGAIIPYIYDFLYEREV